MTTQHTLGTWVARPDPNACLPDDWCVGTGPENIDKVAVCSKCDAHLIAAAPDLLAALQLLVAGIENSVSPTYIPLQKAREAIAKAEGVKE